MSKQYFDENSVLLNSFYNRTFFYQWKQPRGRAQRNYDNIEIILTTDCNLNCKYCYLRRNEDKLYKKELRSEHDLIISNLGKLLDWLIENDYTPTLDIFSGSPLSQELGFRALETIYSKYKEVPMDKRLVHIVIPSNYTFLLSDELTKKVEYYIQAFEDLGMPMLLSASVDGKYMEQNRPFNLRQDSSMGLFLPDSDKRDDGYYDKVFAFNKKWNKFGLHPMVYARGIENWKQNFLWFQEMMEKHGIPWWQIYLLEIRNVEWTSKSIEHLEDFVEFLVRWSWEKVNKNSHDFIEFLRVHKGFNILTNSMFKRVRGSACSIQTSLMVRLADLKIVPCHRTMYDGYEYGQFVIKDGKIDSIKALNTELALGIAAMDQRNQPMCVDCAIKEICPAGCLGSQLEVNGDLFTPIPTVCELYHRKNYRILKTLEDIGQIDNLKRIVGQEVKEAYDLLLELGGKFNG